MNCKNCDNEVTGRKVYCSDKCRKAFKRKSDKLGQDNADKPNSDTQVGQPFVRAAVASFLDGPETVDAERNAPPLHEITPETVEKFEQAGQKYMPEPLHNPQQLDCPDDWLLRVCSLPVGVVHPVIMVDGSMRDLTDRALQQSMPRMNWNCSQEYAEVIYRLLYEPVEDKDFVPCWRIAC